MLKNLLPKKLVKLLKMLVEVPKFLDVFKLQMKIESCNWTKIYTFGWIWPVRLHFNTEVYLLCPRLQVVTVPMRQVIERSHVPTIRPHSRWRFLCVNEYAQDRRNGHGSYQSDYFAGEHCKQIVAIELLRSVCKINNYR